jgi:hypothetical protein
MQLIALESQTILVSHFLAKIFWKQVQNTAPVSYQPYFPELSGQMNFKEKALCVNW